MTASPSCLRMQVASDLHLEFYHAIPPDMITPAAPYLALLGDIGLPDRESYAQFLFDQAARFQKVFVLLGNHEFYQGGRGRSLTYREVKERVRSICAQRPNIVLLDKTSLLLDGVRVLGCTLWSDVPSQEEAQVGRSLTDYHVIYTDSDPAADGESGATAALGAATGSAAGTAAAGGASQRPPQRLIRVADTCAWHRDEVQWLAEELRASKERGEPNSLVLTHHTPSIRGTSHPKYDDSPLNCAFSTDLPHLLRDAGTNVHTWCFGHTHYNSDFTYRGTRLVSNQHGYFPMEIVRDYSPSFVVEVPSYTA